MNVLFKPFSPYVLVQWAVTAIVFVAFHIAGLAGEGHDHGPASVASTTGPSLAHVAPRLAPRFEAHSERLEAVGTLANGELSVLIDRYDTNAPLLQAQAALASGSTKLVGRFHADIGDYSFSDKPFLQPGTYPITLTVQFGSDTDTLAGELVVPELAHDAADNPAVARPWLRAAGYAAAALVVLLLVVVWTRRGPIALKFIAAVAFGLCATASFDAFSGEGHDHSEAPPAANGTGPKRQPDGSVFLPKLSQRQLGVQTVIVQISSQPATVELTGRVVADPNAGGRVQPLQAGRIEAGPRGLPQLGQAVKQGEVLAVVRSSVSAIERSNQQALIAELNASLELARKRSARLVQLEGTVPQKDLEAAQAEVVSLTKRLAALSPSVLATESLLAPVSGVIAAANVVAGQVVDARELLFDIVDPTRLRVEAHAFDASLLGHIASAYAVPAPGTRIALQFVGAGRTLVEGAIPLQFRTTGPPTFPLAIHQPVKVLVQTSEQLKGWVLPTAALVKSASNQDTVWVHTGAEQFVPRTVRFAPLDGARVSVLDGLNSGDRVVTHGAPLVNQVR